jgi:tRNA 2-selenouridine synthase
MRASPCVRLDAPLDVRVTLLLDEYGHFLADRRLLDTQLDCLVGLHGREEIAAWKALAAQGLWRDFVARLLMEHYDPAYRRSSFRNFELLPEAEVVRISSAEESAFLGVAALLARKIGTDPRSVPIS